MPRDANAADELLAANDERLPPWSIGSREVIALPGLVPAPGRDHVIPHRFAVKDEEAFFVAALRRAQRAAAKLRDAREHPLERLNPVWHHERKSCPGAHPWALSRA